MELDHVGFFYKYNKPEELKPDFIRRHIHFREGIKTYIDAPTVTQAINTFYNEWDGAKVGGKKEEQKALWIDRELTIYEMPHCTLLNKSRLEGRYICGTETNKDGSGEFGMCLIEGFDAPCDCTIHDYNEIVYDLNQEKKLPEKTIIIRGKEYKYLTVKDTMAVYNACQVLQKRTNALDVIKKANSQMKQIILEA
jgi:hypothetical protein